MKTIIILATLIAATGCAQRVWVQDSVSHGQAQKDFRECEYDAKKNSYVPMYGSGIGAGIEEGMRYNDIMSTCMTSKGYTLK